VRGLLLMFKGLNPVPDVFYFQRFLSFRKAYSKFCIFTKLFRKKTEIRKLWTAYMFLRINSHTLLLSSRHKFASNLPRVANICKVFLKGGVSVIKGYISTE